MSHHCPKSMANTTLSRLGNRSWTVLCTGMFLLKTSKFSFNSTGLVTHLPLRCVIIFLDDTLFSPPRLLITIYDRPPRVHHTE